MADAIIEMGFIISMVRWLHFRAGKSFDITSLQGSTFELHGKPAGLLVDQGHTSNGAAGTALVLIGFGGLLTIYLERRRIARKIANSRPSGLFTFWVVMTVLSSLLTLAALIYTFVLTYQSNGQHIDVGLAAQNPDPLTYPTGHWTPETWFRAVLELDLTSEKDRGTIEQHLRIMRGWRWNLIPLLVLGLATAAVAVWEWARMSRRRAVRSVEGKEGAF